MTQRTGPDAARSAARKPTTSAPRKPATSAEAPAAGTGGGPAVHMLRRRTSMAFAGGAYAYPGGGV
ncbi:NUDIX hydrolase, partial [Streptomyces sp. sk2.1]